MLLNATAQEATQLMTELDHSIPFLPVFSIAYLSFFPFLLGSYIFICFFSDRMTTVLIAVLLCQIGSSLCFILFQTTVPRPMVHHDMIFSDLVRFIYSNDRPYNCFPSTHVAHSLICYFYLRTKVMIYRVLYFALIAGIVLSTLFLKQHTVSDVVAGMFLALASVWLAPKISGYIKAKGAEKAKVTP